MFCRNCGQELQSGVKFCKSCGFIVSVKSQSGLIAWFKNHKKSLLFSTLVIMLIISIGILYEPNDQSNSEASLPQVENTYVQEDITAAVVNIICEDSVDPSQSSGGSGTIMTNDGIIITNSHVIPQDEKSLRVTTEGCLVILPNPETGQPMDFYRATPIVIPDLSEEYDIAFLEITGSYYDEDEEKYVSTYPRKFPAYDDAGCTNENIKLGEPVRIFGYPAISGGTSLTVTEGVVSSFPGDGLIMTSAKIDHGNSGGLAIDKNGCFLGIPSAVSSGEYESLGIIISPSLYTEFISLLKEKKMSGLDIKEVSKKTNSDTIILRLAKPAALRDCPSTNCKILRYYAETTKVVGVDLDETEQWVQIISSDDFGETITGWMHISVFEE